MDKLYFLNNIKEDYKLKYFKKYDFIKKISSKNHQQQLIRENSQLPQIYTLKKHCSEQDFKHFSQNKKLTRPLTKLDKNIQPINTEIIGIRNKYKVKRLYRQSQGAISLNCFPQLTKQISSTSASKLNGTQVTLKKQKSAHNFSLFKLDSIKKSDFKMIKCIGKGRYGQVWQSIQKNTGLVVAIKIVKKSKIKEQNMMNQFIQQLKLQLFVNHPNIIKTYGFFFDFINFYIIMELCTDGHLYQALQKKKFFTQQQTSIYTKQILEGVQKLHDNKIIHRDLKAQNIVLSYNILKICDFGCAVISKQGLRQTVCGTPLYFSPELIGGYKYDEKVDIWSIGILAYQLRYGRSPFNINETQHLSKIMTYEIDFPNNVSKNFKQLINKALEKNPLKRLVCKQLLKLPFLKQSELNN